jgi:hypothetical protein
MIREPNGAARYSIEEIDNMRQWVRQMYRVPHVDGDAFIERRLRTLMQNGTHPADIENMAKQRQAEFQLEITPSASSVPIEFRKTDSLALPLVFGCRVCEATFGDRAQFEQHYRTFQGKCK